MKDQSAYLFLNREKAAQQLISQLWDYKNKNCSIVAISNGAVVMGKFIAEQLNADLVFAPGERIIDPANQRRSIGVVGFDYMIADDILGDIPQGYVYRQTKVLQAELLSRYPKLYYPIRSGFHNKIVIIIDDSVYKSDEILACLKTIEKQQPKEIIVAVPVITHDAAHSVIQQVDATIFIHVVTDHSVKRAYLSFNPVDDEEVAILMNSDEEIMMDAIEEELENLVIGIKPVNRSDLKWV